MTTIAYHHSDRQIAIDSRITSGGSICTDNAIKSVKRNGRRYFFSGAPSDEERFIREYEQNKCSDDLECYAFIIEKGKAYKINQSGNRFLTTELMWNEASGSGCDFAVAAMDLGKSAKEAVKYAMTRDVYTGGRVRVFNVK